MEKGFRYFNHDGIMIVTKNKDITEDLLSIKNRCDSKVFDTLLKTYSSEYYIEDLNLYFYYMDGEYSYTYLDMLDKIKKQYSDETINMLIDRLSDLNNYRTVNIYVDDFRKDILPAIQQIPDNGEVSITLDRYEFYRANNSDVIIIKEL